MFELPANLPQSANGHCRHKNNSVPLYSDVTCNYCDFISQEDNELPDKSYEDEDSPNEICAFKLDQGKIDELANDYNAEMCVSSNRESAIQKGSYEETVKSDDTRSRNEDESRCKSNRKRKARRKMPEGVIVDLGNDIYGTSQDGIKISVISMPSLIPKIRKNVRSSTLNRTSRNKAINKIFNNSILAVLYAKNCNKIKKLSKQRGKNHKRRLIDNKSHSDVKAISSISKQLKDALKDEQDLRVENNLQSFRSPDETLDSTIYCYHHDCASVDIDNARYPALNAEQTLVDARRHIANDDYSIFNKHRGYHICDREDCNADGSDFNTEMQVDSMAEYYHPGYTHAKGCRCLYDSCECHPDVNMQHDCYCTMPARAVRLSKNNSAFLKNRQRQEAEQFESGQIRPDVAPEFATVIDEYSSSEIELGDRCTNCDAKRGTSRCAKAMGAFVDASGAVDPRDSRIDIDTRSASCARSTRTTTMTTTERDDESPNKSDSLKAVDTWDERACWDDCIGRRCGYHVLAVPPSHPVRSPGRKGGYARGVDPKWKRVSIETDAQQLDYKWKRRIATVDAGTRASVDFKGKRDSRYKSDEAIRVQLRESSKIRKRESLQMVEATSQTRSDNTNVYGKRRATRDYSLWTSLQMDKIWSQVRDAYRNVVKLAATSVGRVVKNAPKSERAQRNHATVLDATSDEDSFDFEEISGNTYRKDLMHSKYGRESHARQERTNGDVKKYRENTKASMRKEASRRDMRKLATRRNAGEGKKDGRSCVFHDEREADGYRDIVEFLPRNGMCGQDGNVYSQFRSTESATYLEDLAYSGPRNRGGSDDKQIFARGIEDETDSVPRIYEDARSHRRSYRNSVSKKCACYDGSRKLRYADVPGVSGNNPLQHRSTTVSLSEDNKHGEAQATPEQTRSREKMESYEDTRYAADTEIARNSTIAKIADATAISSTETDPSTIRSSTRNDPCEPVASTSKWEPPSSLVSSDESRENRSDFRSPFRATAMKFWRKRSRVDNKIIAAPMFKRNGRGIGRRELSTAAVTHDNSGMKITQIEPSTVQTAREDNKRRTYVNVRMRTPDTIVTRILSRSLVSGKKKRVLMSVTLQVKSDSDVSVRKEVGTQTSSNNVTSVGIDTYGHPDKYPEAMLRTTSKMLKCFVCDKPNCYEIKESNDSITLKDALIAEYPEISELINHFAERRTDIEISP